MKQGWEYKKLGEVCCPKKDIKRANKCFQKEDAIRYIDISSVDNTSHTIASYSDYIFKDAPSRAQQVVETGDIVLSLVRPNLKNIAIVKDCYENMVASSGFCVLRVNKIIDNRYLFYIVTSPTYTEYLLKNVSGANYPAVTEEIVKKWEFPLPPLSEQQSIVAELDKINEVIDLKKAQLKDLDLLAQSIFYEMFGDPIENPKGWEVKKLIEVVDESCTISYGIVQPGDGVEDGIPVVRPVDLVNDVVEIKNLKKTTQEISDSYKRSILDGTEILMCVRGTTGIVSYASSELKGCNVTRGIVPIKAGNSTERTFLFQQFRSAALQELIAERTYGATLKQINMKDLRSLPLILPPLFLQQSFASKIQAIESQKSAIKQSLAEVETLLASRMDYWFN